MRPKRSTFDLSHDLKASGKMGYLIPTMCIDCVPGDYHRLNIESLIRFAPLISPVMHRFRATFHTFFVPKRLLWENFEKYITNTKDPLGNPYVKPFIEYAQDDGLSQMGYTPLMDYLGLPKPVDALALPEKICALPLAAYQLIWKEWYRDQNLQPVNDDFGKVQDGDNTFETALGVLRRRAWQHDYFTSCLPFAQKGDAVLMPVQGTVEFDPGSVGTPGIIRDMAGAEIGGTLSSQVASGSLQVNPGGGAQDAVYDPDGTLVVNNGTSTLRDLRIAESLQRWLETMARVGTRYTEYLRGIFDVKSSDARLQRPEYKGGITTPIIISEVLNTSATIDEPQGNMAGHGVGVAGGETIDCYCEEHGYLMTIMSILPDTAYQQGIPKHFLKTGDVTEEFTPHFENIGEQEVKNKEVYAFQGPSGDNTFGYIPRYAEYKFENNRVAGDFRDTLSFWTASRIFETPPALNSTFVECQPTTRIFAVEDEDVDNIWFQVYHNLVSSRNMSYYSNPGLV